MRRTIGIVTKHLFDLIAKQVEDHRLVVWYDPEPVYTAAAAELQLPNTAVACYNGSFFQLRRDLHFLLNAEEPPCLAVSVAEDPGYMHKSPIETEVAGV